MAKRLEELDVYKKAVEFCAAVNALLERPAMCRNPRLHDQIDEANDSITANMSEGFEQGSDAGFVRYLQYSKGSTAEVIARLRQCRVKRYITEEEFVRCRTCGEQLTRMTGKLIAYLNRCGWRDRGRFQASRQPEDPSADKNPDAEPDR